MFRPNTTLVIGAGAGAEINFPVGEKLAKDISNQLDFDEGKPGNQELRNILQHYTPSDWFTCRNAAIRVSQGIVHARSIDGYLQTHADNEHIQFCGKMAILFNILERERSCPLFSHQGDRLNNVNARDSWFGRFSQRLFDGCEGDIDKALARVSVVSFNYDRCFEHFMRHAVANYFAIDFERAVEHVERMSIQHPYGTAGHLPGSVGDKPTAFGEQHWALDATRLIDMIRTYSEGNLETEFVSSIKETMRTTETLIFLGFGFLQQNMELLQPSQRNSNVAKTYATAYELAEDQLDEVRGLIRRHFFKKDQRHIWADPNVGCAGFFQRYDFGLTEN